MRGETCTVYSTAKAKLGLTGKGTGRLWRTVFKAKDSQWYFLCEVLIAAGAQPYHKAALDNTRLRVTKFNVPRHVFGVSGAAMLEKQIVEKTRERDKAHRLCV